MSTSTLQYIAFGLFLLISVIGGIAFDRLTRNLERYDTPQWIALGRPRIFAWRYGFNPRAMRDELHFFWYLLSRQYRTSNVRRIRILGEVNLACFVAMWTIALWSIMFGDLKALEFNLTFSNKSPSVELRRNLTN